MLGRKNYSPDELFAAQEAVREQLTAYRNLADAVDEAADPAVTAALEALEPVLFAALTVSLDRIFVHRLRAVAGKDTNPLTEVELLVDSIQGNRGVLRPLNPIRYQPDKAVLGLPLGERVRLTADSFERLAQAFLDELGTRFA